MNQIHGYHVWDHRFLDLAEHIAWWSKDPSTQVGAVITSDQNRVVSMGYNGYPRKVADTYASRDQKIARTIHAEANALHFANVPVEGCSIYVTHPPCSHCAAHIIQRGISRVLFNAPGEDFLSRWKDSFEEALSMFEEAGVQTWKR